MLCLKGLINRGFPSSTCPLAAMARTIVLGSTSRCNMLGGKGLIKDFTHQLARWWQRQELMWYMTQYAVYLVEKTGHGARIDRAWASRSGDQEFGS